MSTPYTFWKGTLPDGGVVKVIISPWPGEVGIVVHLNGVLQSFESAPTVAQAERRARQLRTQLLGGEDANEDGDG